MAEHRRIPQVEQLEVRDMPAMLGMPLAAPPLHPGADLAPQVAVLTPSTPAVAGQSPATRDVIAPIAGSGHGHPFAAVWQQCADALYSRVDERTDSVTADWAPRHTPPTAAVPVGVTAPEPEACAAADAVGAEREAPPQPAPTIAGVQRYAWRSVNRHRVDDRDDAVQQICLEWLLLAATIATTYDDVRRIVSRVLNRAYRRMKKQELALDLLDVPVQADPVQEAFRDMQLDRDLGMNDLTDREWEVIRLRQEGWSFTEIGVQLGIRRQRAYDVFMAALSCLRKRYQSVYA